MSLLCNGLHTGSGVHIQESGDQIGSLSTTSEFFSHTCDLCPLLSPPPPPPPPAPLGDATISACYLQLQSRHAGVHVQTAGPDRLHHQTTCTRLHAGHLLRHQGEEGGREGGVGDVRGSAAIVTSSLLRKHTVPEAICCCSNKVCHVIRIRTKFHLHAR